MSEGCSSKAVMQTVKQVLFAEVSVIMNSRQQRHCLDPCVPFRRTGPLHTYASNYLYCFSYFSKVSLISVQLLNLWTTFLEYWWVKDMTAGNVSRGCWRSPLSPVSSKLPSWILRKIVFGDWLIMCRAPPRCNSDERCVGVHWRTRVRWHLQDRREWLIIAVWVQRSNKAPRHH